MFYRELTGSSQSQAFWGRTVGRSMRAHRGDLFEFRNERIIGFDGIKMALCQVQLRGRLALERHRVSAGNEDR